MRVKDKERKRRKVALNLLFIVSVLVVSVLIVSVLIVSATLGDLIYVSRSARKISKNFSKHLCPQQGPCVTMSPLLGPFSEAIFLLLLNFRHCSVLSPTIAPTMKRYSCHTIFLKVIGCSPFLQRDLTNLFFFGGPIAPYLERCILFLCCRCADGQTVFYTGLAVSAPVFVSLNYVSNALSVLISFMLAVMCQDDPVILILDTHLKRQKRTQELYITYYKTTRQRHRKKANMTRLKISQHGELQNLKFTFHLQEEALQLQYPVPILTKPIVKELALAIIIPATSANTKGRRTKGVRKSELETNRAIRIVKTSSTGKDWHPKNHNVCYDPTIPKALKQTLTLYSKRNFSGATKQQQQQQQQLKQKQDYRKKKRAESIVRRLKLKTSYWTFVLIQNSKVCLTGTKNCRNEHFKADTRKKKKRLHKKCKHQRTMLYSGHSKMRKSQKKLGQTHI
ncbi:hypothetical protein M0802_004510 [Mischocyttarus mexicanus]|nr:hypothetical protein M0802_004510 [Mischocyttarus mexicanus]